MDETGKLTLESMSQAVWYNQWTLNKFKEYLKGDILEIGSGIGNFTETLSEFGQVYTIDINQEYVEIVKNKKNGKITAGFGDIEKGQFFFKDKKFNAIVCLNVLEHIEKDERAIANIYHLLKAGGSLILLVPAHEKLYGKIDESIGHFRRYDKKGLITKLEGANFKIEKLSRLNAVGAIGWWLAGKILKKGIVESRNIKIFNLVAPVILPFEDKIKIPFGTSLLVIATK